MQLLRNALALAQTRWRSAAGVSVFSERTLCHAGMWKMCKTLQVCAVYSEGERGAKRIKRILIAMNFGSLMGAAAMCLGFALRLPEGVAGIGGIVLAGVVTAAILEYWEDVA